MLALCWLLALGDAKQVTPPPAPTRDQVELSLPRLLASGNEAQALAMIEMYLAVNPNDSQVLFDAARVASRLGDPRGAAVYAIRAIRAGWLDDKAFDEHPDLLHLRGHESWEQVKAVREQRPTAPRASAPTESDALARVSLEAWLTRFGGGKYRVDQCPSLKIITASSIEPEGLRRTTATLEREAEVLSRVLFGELQPDTVLLVIATPADAEKFLRRPEEGGVYDHSDRRLVTRDTGSSLRHEYAHVRHYGHMQRLHQKHPIWIQEGIATLFEDWRIGAKDELIFLPNLRANDAYDSVRNRKAIPWIDFFALDSNSFMQRARENYAQVRSMMMYIASQGKLSEWYRLYTSTGALDPSGRRALEETFAAPIGRIEAQWRQWVHDRGREDSTVDSGDGVMGIAISNLPDGVRVDSVQPGAPAQRAGIRVGDVITDIDTAEIRSVGDYIMATAQRRNGENIKVRFRRANSYSIVEVHLASGHANPP